MGDGEGPTPSSTTPSARALGQDKQEIICNVEPTNTIYSCVSSILPLSAPTVEATDNLQLSAPTVEVSNNLQLSTPTVEVTSNQQYISLSVTATSNANPYNQLTARNRSSAGPIPGRHLLPPSNNHEH